MDMKKIERFSYAKDDHTGIWMPIAVRRISFEPIANLNEIETYVKSELTEARRPKKYRYLFPENPMRGHCYHATQAIHFLFSCECFAKSATDEAGEIHWWIEHEGRISDVTAEQFNILGIKPPYDSGKVTKWYGWKNRPHQKSLDIMVSVLLRMGKKFDDVRAAMVKL